MDTETLNIDLFKDSVSTIKKASMDDGTGEKRYMTDSQMQVIYFDEVKGKYVRALDVSETPCSVDALHIQNGIAVFIEFKNGKMTTEKIYNIHYKIYDSLLIFGDIMKQNVSSFRKNLDFILVYNEAKNPDDPNSRQKSSKAEIADRISQKGKTRHIRFNLERFQNLYFRNVYTYTEREFQEKFLRKLENAI